MIYHKARSRKGTGVQISLPAPSNYFKSPPAVDIITLPKHTQTGITTPTKSSIYDYDDRISRTWNLIKKELSKNNQDIIERYDNLMITSSMAKATRHKHLQTILNLTRFLGKDWEESSKNDIDKLVVEIVRRYANDNGQETYSSYDHKH